MRLGPGLPTLTAEVIWYENGIGRGERDEVERRAFFFFYDDLFAKHYLCLEMFSERLFGNSGLWPFDVSAGTPVPDDLRHG